MGWNDPETHIYVTDEILTATTMNTFVRQNFNDLHRRTTTYGAYVQTGTPFQTTDSTSYTDLATPGPGITVEVGQSLRALISVSALVMSDNTALGAWASYDVSGAVSYSAADLWAINFTPPAVSAGALFGRTQLWTNLAPGLCTFTMKYRSQASPAIAAFEYRHILATPLGS